MAPYFWLANRNGEEKENEKEKDRILGDRWWWPGDDISAVEGEISENGEEGGDKLRRGPWSPEEDDQLRKLVKKNGRRNWSKLGSFMNRTGKSCRLRWHNHLKPGVVPVTLGPITPQEDKVIVTMHKRVGNRWSLIAQKLPGRTDNQVKNRWNSTLRRRRQHALNQQQQRKATGRATAPWANRVKPGPDLGGGCGSLAGPGRVSGPERLQYFGCIEGARSLMHPVSPPEPEVRPFPCMAPPAPASEPSSVIAQLKGVVEGICQEELKLRNSML
uniref:Uncharacterized protein n=1 Tax=Kalanchoe fedtschenkoi TaxID=63787 RepID=A0A7N0V9Q1_KALFE